MIITKTFYREKDLSERELSNVLGHKYVSIDTETTGLNPETSDIKLIQIRAGNVIYLVRLDRRKNYSNLSEVFSNKNIKKIFHNAKFDIAFLQFDFDDINYNNIICTKLSEKLINEKRSESSLKDVVKRYKGISLNKKEQLSNWQQREYSRSQIKYAKLDVLYLEDIWLKQKAKLKKQNKFKIAEDLFKFIPIQIKLDSLGLSNIYEY